MAAQLDSLEKVLHQYSPRVDKFDNNMGSNSMAPSPVLARSPLSASTVRSGLPSPDAFGEPPYLPGPPFSPNGTPLYSPGIPGAMSAGGARPPPSPGPNGNFQFPDAPPTLTINGKQRDSAQQHGSIYPAGPSFGAVGEAMQSGASSVAPPTRDASLPGSRFSQDSFKDGQSALPKPEMPAARERTNSTSGVVKGFKRLWRKSSASGKEALTGKNSAAPMPMSPVPMSPHPSQGSMAQQQAAFIAQHQANQSSFSTQNTMVGVPQRPQSPVPSLASDATSPKRGSDIDPFIFDQETTRYPTMPRPNTGSTSSYATTATTATTATAATATTNTTLNTNSGSIGKKASSGILKSFGVGNRARSGSVSTTSSNPGISSSTVPLPMDGPMGYAPRPSEETSPRLAAAGRARTPTISNPGNTQALANFLAEEPPSADRPMPTRSSTTRPGNYI